MFIPTNALAKPQVVGGWYIKSSGRRARRINAYLLMSKPCISNNVVAVSTGFSVTSLILFAIFFRSHGQIALLIFVPALLWTMYLAVRSFYTVRRIRSNPRKYRAGTDYYSHQALFSEDMPAFTDDELKKIPGLVDLIDKYFVGTYDADIAIKAGRHDTERLKEGIALTARSVHRRIHDAVRDHRNDQMRSTLLKIGRI